MAPSFYSSASSFCTSTLSFFRSLTLLFSLSPTFHLLLSRSPSLPLSLSDPPILPLSHFPSPILLFSLSPTFPLLLSHSPCPLFSLSYYPILPVPYFPSPTLPFSSLPLSLSYSPFIHLYRHLYREDSIGCISIQCGAVFDVILCKSVLCRFLGAIVYIA